MLSYKGSKMHQVRDLRKMSLLHPISSFRHLAPWWHTPIIPAVGRLKQSHHECEVSLAYTVRSVSNKTAITKSIFLFNISQSIPEIEITYKKMKHKLL